MMDDTKELRRLAVRVADAELHYETARGESGEAHFTSRDAAGDALDDAVQDWRNATSPEAILALIDRLERAERDAARYRWLREKAAERHDFYANVERWSVSKERGGFGQCFSGELLDAAIDAAMKVGSGGSGA